MSRDSHFEDSGAGPALLMPQPPMPPMNPMQRISNGLSDLDVSSIIRKVFLEQERRNRQVDSDLLAIRDSALDSDKVWDRRAIEDAMQTFYNHPSLLDENGDKIESISLESYFVKYLAMDRLDSQQGDLRNALYNTFDLLVLASKANQEQKASFFNSFPPPKEELICLQGNDSRMDDLKRMLGAKGIERNIIDAYNSASSRAIDLVSLYTNQTVHAKRYIDYILNFKTKQELLDVDDNTFVNAAEIPTAAVARIIEEFPRNFREYLTRSLSNQELDQEIPPKQALEAKVREVSRGIVRYVNLLKNKLDSSGKIEIEYEGTEKITEEDLLGIIKEDDFDGLGNPRITTAIPLLIEKLGLKGKTNHYFNVKEDGYLEEGSELRFNIDRMRQVLYEKLTKELEEEFLALTEGMVPKNDNPLPAIPLATRIFSKEIGKEVMEKLTSKDPKEIASAIDILHTLSLKTKGNALIHFSIMIKDVIYPHLLKLINDPIINQESLALHLKKINDPDTGIMTRCDEYLNEYDNCESEYQRCDDDQCELIMLSRSTEQVFETIRRLALEPDKLFDVISRSQNPGFNYIGIGDFEELDYVGVLTHMILREDGFKILDAFLDVDGQGHQIPQEFIDELLPIIIENRPNLEYILKLIDKGANINYINVDGSAPLHLAAAHGYVDIVSLLIAKGANIDHLDVHSNTPLHIAARNGHIEVVNLLIAELEKSEKDIDIKNYRGHTPLHLAAANGHDKVTNLLIAKGISVDCVDNYNNTPLHFAVANGHIDAVESLIAKLKELGKNIDTKNNSGNTPLHAAALNGRTEIVKLLMSQEEVNINQENNDGNTPLYSAAQNGHIEVVKSLIDNGAIVDLVNSNFITPLYLAAKNGHAEVASLLITEESLGTTDVNNYTALHIAALNDHVEVVGLLLEKGAYVNAGDRYGDTPLHIAAEDGNTEVINLLINKGAMIDIANSNGNASLHLAAESGRTDAAGSLINAGANVDLRNGRRNTPLHLAAKNGHVDVVRLLIDKVASIDIGNTKGCSALHLAAKNGHTDVVKFLLDSGANYNILDKQGHPPIYYAAANGHAEISKLFKDKSEELLRQKAEEERRKKEAKTQPNLFKFFKKVVEKKVDEVNDRKRQAEEEQDNSGAGPALPNPEPDDPKAGPLKRRRSRSPEPQ